MSETGAETYSKLDTLAQSLQELFERLNQIQTELDSAKSEIGAHAAQMGSLSEVVREEIQRQAEARAKIVSDANEAIQKLSLGNTQEEILDIFLQEAEQYVDRAILFLSKDERYNPWKSIGFERARVESILVDGPDDPIMRSAHRQRIIYKAESPEDVFPWLYEAGELPRSAICIPLVFNEFVPLVFYGDSSGSVSLDGVELLTHLTVLVLKNNFLQALVSTPAEKPEPAVEEKPQVSAEPSQDADFLSHMSAAEAAGVGIADVLLDEDVQADVGTAEAAETESITDEEVAIAEEVTDVAEASSESVAEEPVPEEEQVSESEQPGHSDEYLWEEVAPVELPEEAFRGEEEPAEAPPFEEFSPPETFEETGTPEPEPVEAEPVDLSEDEQRLHSDARRFARLLASEIKLYNENQVQEGREKGDLYVRLSRDIDRSREMYQKRAHPCIQESKDYFHEELIRIVAGGDERLLGDAYPGPRL